MAADYAVQIHSCTTRAQAYAFAGQLKAGCAEARVSQTGATWKVGIGSFARYGDALYARDRLRERGFANAFIARFSDTDAAETTSPLELALYLKPHDLLPATSQSDPSSTVSAENARSLANAYAILKRNGKSAARPHFESLLAAADCASGEAALRVAYILDSQQSKGESLELFGRVAQGLFPSTPAARAEALYRCARLHHGRRDPVRALQTFREHALFCAKHGLSVGDAQVQMSGIYLELAMNAKGTLGEAERFIAASLGNPRLSGPEKATLHLMRAESAAMRNDYKAAQPDTEAALALVDVKSPVALHASYVKAVCLYKKGDYGGAEAVTQRALNSGAQQMPRTQMLNNLTVLQAGLEEKQRPATQVAVQQEESK